MIGPFDSSFPGSAPVGLRCLYSPQVLHFSGGVKPWDFFFDSADRSFEEFCRPSDRVEQCSADRQYIQGTRGSEHCEFHPRGPKS